MPAGRIHTRLIDLIDDLYAGNEVFFRHVRTAKDLMTVGVKVLRSDDKVRDAVALMEQHQLRHIPVVDWKKKAHRTKGPEGSTLVGIVSERDLARSLSPNIRTPFQTEADDAALERPITSVMTREPRVVNPDTPLAGAIQVMVENKFDCLPVVLEKAGGHELVGMLTTTDIIRSFVRLEALRKTRSCGKQGSRLIDFVRNRGRTAPGDLLVADLFDHVESIMTRKVISVPIGASLQVAMKLMKANGIRRLLVLDDGGTVRGVLSNCDVLWRLPPLPRPRANPSNPLARRDEIFQVDMNDPATRNALAERVECAMVENPLILDPGAPTEKVAEVLCDHRFGSMPVIISDKTGIRGIVTEMDFLSAILITLRVVGVRQPARQVA